MAQAMAGPERTSDPYKSDSWGCRIQVGGAPGGGYTEVPAAMALAAQLEEHLKSLDQLALSLEGAVDRLLGAGDRRAEPGLTPKIDDGLFHALGMDVRTAQLLVLRCHESVGRLRAALGA